MPTSNPKLQTRLREIAESLLCREGSGHYCPNCGNTTFDAAMSLKLLADQIGAPDETTDGHDWPREISALLDGLGNKAIRVREGGGPENLMASLAVTLSRHSPEEPEKASETRFVGNNRCVAHGVFRCTVCIEKYGDPNEPEKPAGARDWVIVCGNSWYGQNGKFVAKEWDARGFPSANEAKEFAKGMRCPWSVRERAQVKAAAD